MRPVQWKAGGHVIELPVDLHFVVLRLCRRDQQETHHPGQRDKRRGEQAADTHGAVAR